MKEDLQKAIVNYLETHRHCTLATVREDGSPQASTVSYVNDSQKNLLYDRSKQCQGKEY